MGGIRWDPFRDLLSLQERMNKLFEESMGRTTGRTSELSEWDWEPLVDILEQKGEILLKAEMPGVKLEDVSLQVKNNVLTLSGIRHFSKETQKENYHRIERSYGKFSRSFSLPGIVDQSEIRAKLKNGLLEVRLPKSEGTKENPIPIEIRKS